MKIKILISVLLPAALMGCLGSKNDSPTENGVMGINSCIARSSSGEAATVNDLGLFALKADGGIFNGADNLHATLTGGSWNMSNVELSSESVNIVAYSPYSSSVTRSKLHISSSSQIDWLAARGMTATTSSNKLDIVMSHLLTKIEFKLTDAIVTKVSLTSYKGEADYNLSTGILSVSDNTSTVTNSSDSIILLPESSATTKKFTLTIGNKEYPYSFSADKLEVGKKYICNLTIKNNDIHVIGVSLNDWAVGGEYSGYIQEQ